MKNIHHIRNWSKKT